MFGVAPSNMSEEVSLYDLLNLSIGTPQKSSVNFGALHALLLAMLKQLDLQEIKTRWRGSCPGYRSPGTVGVSAPAEEEEVQPDSELQKRTASPSAPARGSAAADQLHLFSRIQTCEDGLSKSMRLILDLNKHNEHLKEQMEELRQQHEMAGDVLRTVSLVESCCHRVDVLEETVESLRDAGLPGDRESGTEKPGDSGVDDQAMKAKETSSPSSSNLTKPPQSSPPPSYPNKHTVGPAAPSSPRASEEKSQEEPDTSLVQSAPPPQTGVKENSTAAGKAPTSESNNSKPSPEAVEALRSVHELQERLVQLEARVAALERGKVDQTQLAQLRELITNRGSRGDAFSNLMDQLNEQRALIDGLMSDRGKLDSLEDMLMGLMSPERGSTSEAASEREESDSKGYGELRYLRKRVQRLEEDVLQLKVKHAQCEERASDRQLQDQLDDLRRTLEDTISSFTSQLSTSLKDEAVRGESDSQELQQSADWSALNARVPNIGEKLSLLFERYEQLQDAVNRLIEQQPSGGGAEPLRDRESVQQVILQLQADCKRLNEATRSLQDDSREKQRHIEELYKTTEELEVNKADKDMVESEIKADKSALEGKVSRLQFDSVTEQLSSMFHELLNKVTNQEQDWHKLMGKLSTEMQCKLNRIELDSVKKQLEDRWRSIHEKLQAQAAPESEDAAGIRKQLVERFHCLSCDRPVVKHTPGPHLVTLPSFPAFPSHKSIRPFTVYTMEQLRQHYRSLQPGTNRSNFQAANLAKEQLQRNPAVMCRQIESLAMQRRLQHSSSTTAAGVQHERISELADYGHLAASRSCGGGHNANAAGVQRRSGPQHVKHHGQCDADGTVQSEEVDIVGLDGRIYKGRLNVRNSETKLPTIPTKDGVCKNKVKAAASPEVGHSAPLHQPCSPRSAPCSHSASSCSGRDWPVSALGCASQSSITQSTAEPLSNEPLDL